MTVWIMWSIPVYLGFEMLDWILRRYRIDTHEGEGFPINRWICWGTCRALSRKYAADYRYCLIKLPSWSMERDFTRGYDAYRLQQRALYWFEPFGWRTTFV